MINSSYTNKFLVFSILVLSLFSCAEFVDVDLEGSRVTTDVIFADDNTATAAITGLYFGLSTSSIGAGVTSSLSRLAGLSADELYDFRRTAAGVEFETNNIDERNSSLLNLWNSLYKVIYNCNSVLEGIERSKGISPNARQSLMGETRFIRAFCYFNLVNFFGDVPLVLTTNYATNATTPRTDRTIVYDQIILDLQESKQALATEYQGIGRTRVNSRVASALLAKVYLFLGNWEGAVNESSILIEDPKYVIAEDLRSVFAVGSLEAIWQVAPEDSYNSTDEARYYVVVSSPRYLLLRKEFVESFNAADLRLATWIGTKLSAGVNLYYPFKYTLQPAGLPIHEYSAILRLAEQYLIRAEARVHRGDLSGAIADLDVVRGRAGLPLIAEERPDVSSDDLLLAIKDERKFELFTEWGNRWFDLKRAGDAVGILSTLKPDFTINDELYPLPATERLRNPFLGEQNPGY